MTSQKQIEANKENALKSTGPKDCENSRFNAVRYGITGKCVYSKKDEQIVNEIYQDLADSLEPVDAIDRILVARIAKIIWRLQKANQLEEGNLINNLIRRRNRKDSFSGVLASLDYDNKEKEELMIEYLDGEFQLLDRYETSIENRLLKLIKFYHQKKRNFKF